jgi:hypothetical protein
LPSFLPRFSLCVVRARALVLLHPSGRKSIPVLDWWRSQRRASTADRNEV